MKRAELAELRAVAGRPHGGEWELLLFAPELGRWILERKGRP